MQPIKALHANDKGTSALEFALVAPAALALIMFVMVAGLIVYMNLALDYATGKAARAVMIGTIQKNAVSQSDFRTKYVCPYLPAAMNCGDVIVNLYTLSESAGAGGYSDYVNLSAGTLNIPVLSNGSATYAVSQQGAYQYLEVHYPATFLPAMVASALGGSTYNGKKAFVTVSTAAFRNEQF